MKHIRPIPLTQFSARQAAVIEHNQRQLGAAIAALRGKTLPAPAVREPAFDRSKRKGA